MTNSTLLRQQCATYIELITKTRQTSSLSYVRRLTPVSNSDPDLFTYGLLYVYLLYIGLHILEPLEMKKDR